MVIISLLVTAMRSVLELSTPRPFSMGNNQKTKE